MVALGEKTMNIRIGAGAVAAAIAAALVTTHHGLLWGVGVGVVAALASMLLSRRKPPA